MPSVSFTFFQALPQETIMWVRRTHCQLTLILLSGQRDPNSWRPRSFAKSKRARMTASFTSHTKTWSWWKVESSPTTAYTVSRVWPHVTRVTITHLSIPELITLWKPPIYIIN